MKKEEKGNMKVQLMKESHTGDISFVKGLFFETDGGVLIMEDDFDIQHYDIFASSGFVIAWNSKEGKGYSFRIPSIKNGEIDGNETDGLACDKINDAIIGKELAEKYSLNIIEGVLFAGNKGIMILGNRIGEIWDTEKMMAELKEKLGNNFQGAQIIPGIITNFSENLGKVKNIILRNNSTEAINIFSDDLPKMRNLKTITIENFNRECDWFKYSYLEKYFFEEKTLELVPEEYSEINMDNEILKKNWKNIIIVMGKAGEKGKLYK